MRNHGLEAAYRAAYSQNEPCQVVIRSKTSQDTAKGHNVTFVVYPNGTARPMTDVDYVRMVHVDW